MRYMNEFWNMDCKRLYNDISREVVTAGVSPNLCMSFFGEVKK